MKDIEVKRTTTQLVCCDELDLFKDNRPTMSKNIPASLFIKEHVFMTNEQIEKVFSHDFKDFDQKMPVIFMGHNAAVMRVVADMMGLNKPRVLTFGCDQWEGADKYEH